MNFFRTELNRSSASHSQRLSRITRRIASLTTSEVTADSIATVTLSETRILAELLELLQRYYNMTHVVQLWQRDRAKLDTFSINVQRYSQNHAQNCIFVPPYGGIRGNISALFKSVNDFLRKSGTIGSTERTAVSGRLVLCYF